MATHRGRNNHDTGALCFVAALRRFSLPHAAPRRKFLKAPRQSRGLNALLFQPIRLDDRIRPLQPHRCIVH
jgi:hypothetical protein